MTAHRFVALLFLGSCLTVGTACSSTEETSQARDPNRFFDRLDRDGDGRVSWDEFKDGSTRGSSLEQRFQTMDKDTDGFVTREEFLAARPGDGKGRPGDRARRPY